MPFPFPAIRFSILIFVSFAFHLFSNPCTSTQDITLTGGYKRHLHPHGSHVFGQVKRITTYLFSYSDFFHVSQGHFKLYSN